VGRSEIQENRTQPAAAFWSALISPSAHRSSGECGSHFPH